MADGVFNISKGQGVELYRRVKNNDPANSAFIIVALKATGLEADSVLRDYDNLSLILAAANDEATNVNYARKTYTDADLAALPAPDDANDRFDIDISDPVWSLVAAAGGAWGKLLVCYDGDTTAGDDTNIQPVTFHDFAVTPDGTTIQGQVNVAGFFRAS